MFCKSFQNQNFPWEISTSGNLDTFRIVWLIFRGFFFQKMRNYKSISTAYDFTVYNPKWFPIIFIFCPHIIKPFGFFLYTGSNIGLLRHCIYISNKGADGSYLGIGSPQFTTRILVVKWAIM